MTDAIHALKQALPYVRLYKGKVFVIKAGGRILSKPAALDALVSDVSLLHQVGIRVVFVHGGGPQATELSRKLGLEPRLVAGRRVTDAATLEVAKMVFAGSLSVDVLAAFRRHHTPAVGLSGVDAGLVTARRKPPCLVAEGPGQEPALVDYGLVGDVVSVDAWALWKLLDAGSLPVVSPLACDAEGQVLNVNADTLACAVAKALRAEKLLFLTDADGVLRDPDDPSTLVSCATPKQAEALMADGTVSGGMGPKVSACLEALAAGVRRAHVLSGLRPGALLSEIFTNEGCGTMIAAAREPEEVPA